MGHPTAVPTTFAPVLQQEDSAIEILNTVHKLNPYEIYYLFKTFMCGRQFHISTALIPALCRRSALHETLCNKITQ
jgi:hypothetical protein